MKIQFDSFVEILRSDPKNVETLVILQGFLGASSDEGHIRVYADEALANFVEVPENEILHTVNFDKKSSTLGGSKIWIKSTTAIIYGDPKAEKRAKSTFLEGDIMSAYAQTQPAVPQAVINSDLPPNFTCRQYSYIVYTNYCPPPPTNDYCFSAVPLCPRTVAFQDCDIKTKPVQGFAANLAPQGGITDVPSVRVCPSRYTVCPVSAGPVACPPITQRVTECTNIPSVPKCTIENLVGDTHVLGCAFSTPPYCPIKNSSKYPICPLQTPACTNITYAQPSDVILGCLPKTPKPLEEFVGGNTLQIGCRTVRTNCPSCATNTVYPTIPDQNPYTIGNYCTNTATTQMGYYGTFNPYA